MRISNFDHRAVIVRDEGIIDVERASHGRFSSSTDDLLGRVDELHSWLDTSHPAFTSVIDAQDVARATVLGPVVTSPSQVFAVGLNYRSHAAEMGLPAPTQPMIFAKFASSLAGANATFPLPSPRTDWEAELVVIVGRGGRNLNQRNALSAVAGYCVGQDVSDRDLQMAGTSPQFSLGKSYRNFAPIGPWITTAEDVGDPNDLVIQCSVNGVTYQNATTGDMIFNVAEILTYLSRVCELRPGDLIFTGTPAGVGQGQRPPVFLRSSDEVVTTISGLGELHNRAE